MIDSMLNRTFANNKIKSNHFDIHKLFSLFYKFPPKTIFLFIKLFWLRIIISSSSVSSNIWPSSFQALLGYMLPPSGSNESKFSLISVKISKYDINHRNLKNKLSYLGHQADFFHQSFFALFALSS